MSRRIASLQAEQKTKEELQLLPDDDPEEHNDKDFKDDMAPSYKRKEVAPMPSRRGAGGGICLSDDEEEVGFISQALHEVVDSTVKETAEDVFMCTSNRGNSIGNILARMNRPKKKAKKGAVLDKSIARMLKDDSPDAVVDKDAACKAAKKALSLTGTLNIQENVKFAGTMISVSRTIDKSSKEANQIGLEKLPQSNLDKIVDELKNNKKTINTVVKSSYDWDKFKNEKGIGEELEKYAKDGYVEKQQFLDRVDHRQFENERAERERIRAANEKK